MKRGGDPPASVAITGASGGLGQALALAYAGPGVTLALFGRDPDRLTAAGRACEARGAAVEIVPADVADAAAMRAALLALDRTAPLGLLIANAGVSSGHRADGSPESAEAALRVLSVNVLGVAHSVLPVLERMLERGCGQIALVGSLAARPPLPSSPAYSASKAAVEAYGAALRGAVHARGVRVNVISPGFVATPMSDRLRGPKPLMICADDAARLIRRGLAQDRPRIAFPRSLAAMAAVVALLPQPLAAALVRPLAFRVDPD